MFSLLCLEPLPHRKSCLYRDGGSLYETGCAAFVGAVCMNIITFEKPIQIEIGYWKYRQPLSPGVPYLFLDKEMAKLGQKDESLQTGPINEEPRLYQGEELTGSSLLFVSLGGYGDALCFLQALNALQARYPDAEIDICTHMDIFWLMKQFNFRGGWLSYPPKLDYLKKYDYFQTSDSLQSGETSGEKNITRLFHDLFGVDPDLSASHLTLDSAAQQAMKLPLGSGKRIAIQVDAGNGVNKIYPLDYVTRLSVMLSESLLKILNQN